MIRENVRLQEQQPGRYVYMFVSMADSLVVQTMSCLHLRTNTLMTLSSWSTISLEDVAAAAPQCIRWFQLYIYKDRAVTLDLIRRAERAGYTAIAVTVDTPLLGRREADIRNRFSLPSHLTMGNFTKAGGDLAMGTQAAGASGSGLASYVASLIDKTLTWESIAWLRSNTRLKIVVKGILRVDDAVAAVKAGVDGIWVSNHGARQVDTAPATIEVLADICRAVAGRRVEVYMDGGVTRGTDVVKVRRVDYQHFLSHPHAGSSSRCQGGVHRSSSAVGVDSQWRGWSG